MSIASFRHEPESFPERTLSTAGLSVTTQTPLERTFQQGQSDLAPDPGPSNTTRVTRDEENFADKYTRCYGFFIRRPSCRITGRNWKRGNCCRCKLSLAYMSRISACRTASPSGSNVTAIS
jgi:hypothetical protein